MNTFLTLFFLSSGLLFSETPPVHSNVVADLHLDNFNNELFLEASLDKRMLSVALMSEGDCTPREMLSECGSEYLIDHFHIKVNGQAIAVDQQAMELTKDKVVFRYYLGDMHQKITLVEASSDYLIAYHEHSELKLNISIYDTFRQYSLNAKRPTMKMQVL